MSARMAAVAVMFGLLMAPWPCRAQELPSADPGAPVAQAVVPTGAADTDVVDMEAVVVSGVQPGPGLWRVSKGGHVLYILGTLERPTSGSVKLEGQDPFALDEPRLADFRNRHVGFVFQDHHLLPQCSVLENVLIPTLVHDGDRAGAHEQQRPQRLAVVHPRAV